MGYAIDLPDDIQNVEKHFPVSAESQVLHVSNHCYKFEKRAASMKAGRRPPLPSKDDWTRQALEAAVFTMTLQDW